MIPQEFQEYFQGSDKVVQQQMINTLLGIMDSSSGITTQTDRHAVSCPHCKSKKLRANGKLKQVQRYVCNGCGNHFSFPENHFSFARNHFSFARNHFSFAENHFSFPGKHFSFSSYIFSFWKKLFGFPKYLFTLVLPIKK